MPCGVHVVTLMCFMFHPHPSPSSPLSPGLLYILQTHEKSLCSLPQVLTLNCQVESETDREFWQFQQRRERKAHSSGGVHSSQRWLPLALSLGISGDNVLQVSQEEDRQSNGGHGTSGVEDDTQPPKRRSTCPDSSSPPVGVLAGRDSADDARKIAPLHAISSAPDFSCSQRDASDSIGSDGVGSDHQEEVAGGTITTAAGSGGGSVSGDAGDGGGEGVRGDSEAVGGVEEVYGEYELSMVVCHVKEPWMEPQGNLVAHVKVGSSYHLRKEVRAVCVPRPFPRVNYLLSVQTVRNRCSEALRQHYAKIYFFLFSCFRFYSCICVKDYQFYILMHI